MDNLLIIGTYTHFERIRVNGLCQFEKLHIKKGENEMNIYIVLLPMVSMLIGLYLVCLGLWELRVGIDRKRFITFSFTGLFLIFILPNMFSFLNVMVSNF